MEVQEVDVASPKVLEGCFDCEMQGLRVVTRILNLLGDRHITKPKVGGVLLQIQHQREPTTKEIIYLGSYEQVVSDTTRFCPFADEHFGASILAERVRI